VRLPPIPSKLFQSGSVDPKLYKSEQILLNPAGAVENTGLAAVAVSHNCYKTCFPKVEEKDADNEDLCSEPHSELSGTKAPKYNLHLNSSVSLEQLINSSFITSPALLLKNSPASSPLLTVLF